MKGGIPDVRSQRHIYVEAGLKNAGTQDLSCSRAVRPSALRRLSRPRPANSGAA